MRVLASDLAIGTAMLRATQARAVWWERPEFSLPTSAWDRFRDFLAAHLDKDSDWLEVASAFQKFTDLNSYIAAQDAKAGGDGAAVFDPAVDSAILDGTLAQAQRGGETLVRLLS